MKEVKTFTDKFAWLPVKTLEGELKWFTWVTSVQGVTGSGHFYHHYMDYTPPKKSEMIAQVIELRRRQK